MELTELVRNYTSSGFLRPYFSFMKFEEDQATVPPSGNRNSLKSWEKIRRFSKEPQVGCGFNEIAIGL